MLFWSKGYLKSGNNINMKQQVSSWTFQVNKLLLHFQVLRHPQAFSFLLAWKPQTLATPFPSLLG